MDAAAHDASLDNPYFPLYMDNADLGGPSRTLNKRIVCFGRDPRGYS